MKYTTLKSIIEYLTTLVIGMGLATIMLHFRFKNELLRRELILVMQDGNGYFLMFTILSFFMLVFLGVMYVVVLRWIKISSHKSANRKQEEKK